MKSSSTSRSRVTTKLPPSYRPTMAFHYVPKQKLHVGWFFDETYRANFYLLTPCSTEQFDGFMQHQFKKTTQHEMGGGCCTHLTQDGSFNIIIALRQKPSATASFLDSLCHECFHAAQTVLDRSGVELHDSSEEAYAYLMGSIFRRCLLLLGYAEGSR